MKKYEKKFERIILREVHEKADEKEGTNGEVGGNEDWKLKAGGRRRN